MSKPQSTITLLCSGVALGVYVPALLVNARLRRSGATTDVVVLESLFTPEKQQKIIENKLAFHQSFAVAKMGQRMRRELAPNLDAGQVSRLVTRWAQEQRRLFLVFSGFWMPLVNAYRQRIAPTPCWVQPIHVDAAVSASWKNVTASEEGDQPVWLFDAKTGQVHYQLKIEDEAERGLPIPFDQRPVRILIHGGGWGMGTYQSKIPILAAAGVDLDIIAYDPQEAAAPHPGQRYFMVDPAWSPWMKNRDGEHEFPPFGEVQPGIPTRFCNRPDSHELLQLARQARAIVSKPGGATLIDSWAAATPLVMLEPFGEYEAQNAALWQALGFGIPFPEWEQVGFSPGPLEPLHHNLLRACEAIPDYVDTWRPKFHAFLG